MHKECNKSVVTQLTRAHMGYIGSVVPLPSRPAALGPKSLLSQYIPCGPFFFLYFFFFLFFLKKKKFIKKFPPYENNLPYIRYTVKHYGAAYVCCLLSQSLCYFIHNTSTRLLADSFTDSNFKRLIFMTMHLSDS